MLRVRLARHGSKKRPFFWLVVTQAQAPRDGRFIEKLGTYDPLKKDDKSNFEADRVRHWLSQGAQPSERVQRILAQAGVVPEVPLRDSPKQSMPKKKAQERAQEKAALVAGTQA
jgi:small subunit ribosomal protein S16